MAMGNSAAAKRQPLNAFTNAAGSTTTEIHTLTPSVKPTMSANVCQRRALELVAADATGHTVHYSTVSRVAVARDSA